MNILGREIRWSEQALEQRSHDELTDIGMAFTAAQLDILTGGAQATEGLPAVYRAAQIITDVVASLPMEELGTDGIAEPLTPPILERPNPNETYQTTMSKIAASLVWRGNAYVWARNRDPLGNIETAYVLNPDEVTVAWDRSRLFPLYSWRDHGMAANEELFHVSINHWPGALKGVGPIEAARLMYAGLRAEANMSRRLFEDDSTPSGLLNIPRQLTRDEAKEVQEQWEESHSGRKRPAVLSGGVTFEALTINPVDAQFIEQRNFGVQEVARMFGLFGWFLLVEDGGSMTYTNTESLLRLLLAVTISPTYLERIEQTFSLMLPGRRRARFNTNEMLRADNQARYEAYAVGLEHEFLTIEEVRESERLPRLERVRPQTTVEVNNAG